MTRQVLNRGATANDGTGDTLRQAAQKIEQNFEEIYLKLGGDSNVLMPLVSFDSDGLIFEGSSVNAFETKLTVVDPDADRTVTIPNHTGEVTVNDAIQTLENKTIAGSALVNPDFVSDSSDTNRYRMLVSEPAGDRNITLPLLTDSDEFTFNGHTQTLSNKTLIEPLLTNPRIGSELQDSNGNAYIEFDNVAGSINHFKVTSASNDNIPVISTVGGDADIDLGLEAKGEGSVSVRSRFKLFSQRLTANGNASLDVPMTHIDIGGASTINVADGSAEVDGGRGEMKYLVNTNSGTATINFETGTSLHGGNLSSISMPSYSSVTLCWDGSTWVIINNQGATAS